MQREHVAELQVGDFIQLPPGEWHLNRAAKDKFAEAQTIMNAHTGEGLSPQFQVSYEDRFKLRLERIR